VDAGGKDLDFSQDAGPDPQPAAAVGEEKARIEEGAANLAGSSSKLDLY
jgi:hypothetical protein